MRRTWRSPAACVVLVLAWSTSMALETDQYYAWSRPLADSTDVLNAKVNAEIAVALQQVNAKPSWRRATCPRVARAISSRFRQFIFHEVELWATHSPLVDRVPSSTEEELEFREKLLYRDLGPFDMGSWVPPSPTIALGGVRLGTDKLSHFFSEGWLYYGYYRGARKKGADEAQARNAAIRRGILLERTILGLTSSGVLSRADLEANFEGMRFFAGLCEGQPPALARTDDGWRQVRSFDFRDYVTPEWDESYQASIYTQRQWKKVRPVLLEYCPLLALPEFAAQRRAYALRDRVTPTEQRLEELVGRGKIADPQLFTLESNCGAGDVATGPARAAPGN